MRIQGLSEIADRYDAFLLDVWGVVHDGVSLYPGVSGVFDYLLEGGKYVCILSNNPHPPSVLRQDLVGKGLHQIEKGVKIYNSGGLFLEDVKNAKSGFLAGKVYWIGQYENGSGLQDMLDCTDDIDEASYILLLLYSGDASALDRYDLSARDIPIVCVNPDINGLLGGDASYTSGYFAHLCEVRCGSKVYYYGKPYDGIYSRALSEIPAEKKRVLAIGDTVETDILGAVNHGIDSLLVLGGISKGSEPFAKYEIAKPTYIMNELSV